MVDISKVKVKINRFGNLILFILTKINGWSVDGITLRNTIYIKKGKMRTSLLAHELVHVAQIQRIGFLKFMYRYTKHQIKFGYTNNPFEVEAYYLQEDLSFQKLALLLLTRN